MKLMEHPKHGRHYVYSDNEEVELIKNGWSEMVKKIEEPKPVNSLKPRKAKTWLSQQE